MPAHVRLSLLLTVAAAACAPPPKATAPGPEKAPPVERPAAPPPEPRPATPAPKPAPKPAHATKRVDINADGADVRVVMDRIAREVGTNILVSPEVREPITVRLREIPWREAVTVLAKMIRATVVERPGIWLLTQPPQVTLEVTRAPAPDVLQRIARTAGKTLTLPAALRGELTLTLKEVHWLKALRGVAAVLGLRVVQDSRDAYHLTKNEPVNPGGPRPTVAWPTKRIDVAAEKVDLADLMERIGKQVGLNILVDPDVQERVTITLRRVPWRAAVDHIADVTRCDVEERPGGILLLTQPPRAHISAAGAPLDVFLSLLATAGGKNLIVSPRARSAVDLRLSSVHWIRAIRAAASTHGLSLLERTSDLLLAAPAGPRSVPRPGRGPAPAQATPAAKPTASDASREVDLLFAGLVERAGRRDFDGVVDKMVELTRSMKRHRAAGVSAARRSLKRWRSKLTQHLVLDLVELMVAQGEGNEELTTMVEHLARSDYERVFAGFQRVSALKDRLFARPDDRAARLGTVLFLRATSLADRAKRLKPIANLPMLLTATVVTDGVHVRRGAIINGRIYREGDLILDPRSEKRVQRLHVVDIRREQVVMRYRDTAFTLRLPRRAPPPTGSGVVILNNGAVFVGAITKAGVRVDEVTLTWPHGRQTWQFGNAPHQIRWYSRSASAPTPGYWKRYPAKKFSLDPRYLAQRELERERRKRVAEATVTPDDWYAAEKEKR